MWDELIENFDLSIDGKYKIEEDIEVLEEMSRLFKNVDERTLYVSSVKARCKQRYQAIDNLLSEYKRVLKENEELKEYIAIAPNLDEMTATKYRNIQRDAYIRGRAEEQQKAKQRIYENYIHKQKVKEKIEELDIEISACEYADDDSEEYKQEVEKNKMEFIRERKMLQELLKEKE